MGVRAILALGEQDLLVGLENGDLERWRIPTDGTVQTRIQLGPIETAGGAGQGRLGRVTFLGWMGGDKILVSHRLAGTRFLDWSDGGLEERPGGWSQIKGLCCAGQAQGGTWLMVSERGQAWWSNGTNTPKNLALFGGTDGSPSMVTDYAILSDVPWAAAHETDPANMQQRPASCLYLATDRGVFGVWLGEGVGAETRAELLHLPGLDLMPTAMTLHRPNHATRFLWVTDIEGSAHLFRAPRDMPSVKSRDAALSWVPSGIHLAGLHAARALAAIPPTSDTGTRLVVVQACRNNEVHLTRYLALGQGGAALEPTFLATIANGDTEQLEKDIAPRGEPPVAGLFAPLPDPVRWALTFASFVELVADRDPDLFFSSLSQPNANLALNVLEQIPEEDSAGTMSPRYLAIRLWTDAFLGAIHRYLREPRQRQACYLGLLAWLRQLEVGLTGQGAPGHRIAKALDDAHQDVRKWGLFSSTYVERHSAYSPLRWLSEQIAGAPSPPGSKERTTQTEKRERDRDIYQARLLDRRWDLAALHRSVEPSAEGGQTGEDPHSGPPDAARTCAALHIEEGTFVATTLNSGWFLLYKLTPKEAGTSTPCALEPVKAGAENACFGITLEHRTRAICLTKSKQKGAFFAVYAPTPPRTAEKPARVEVRRFQVKADLVTQEKFPPLHLNSDPRGARESVYSMLDLTDVIGRSVVLLGLRGSGGGPRLALLHLPTSRRRKLLLRMVRFGPRPSDTDHLPAAYPEGTKDSRNPVFALALASSQEAASITVLAGCLDGQIWSINLNRTSLRQPSGDPVRTKRYRVIQRMGAPVWSLAARTWPRSSGPSRIYAGAADGSVVCWQHLEGEPPFVSLWATRETSPITHVEAYRGRFDKVSTPTALDAVVATTQDGRVLLIYDGDKVEEPRRSKGTSPLDRMPIPGVRIDRLQLDHPVFGAAVVRDEAEPSEDEERAGVIHLRLLTAGERATTRLITVHHPRSKACDPEKRRQLLARWSGGGRQGDTVDEAWHLSRRAEKLGGAAAGVGSIQAFQLFHSQVSPPPDGEAPDPLTVPYFLHDLHAFLVLWRHAETRDWTFPRDPTTEEVQTELRRLLTAALGHAHSLDDHRLYETILSEVLELLNGQLVALCRPVPKGRNGRPAMKPARAIRGFSRIYVHLVDAMDEHSRTWAGSPGAVEMKVRIVLMKQIVDGTAYYWVNRAITRMREQEQEPTAEALRDVLLRRVKLSRSMLERGDDVMVLETLRAINISLLRAAKLASGDSSEQGVPWNHLSQLFATLGDLLGRRARAEAGLDDALTHEIARVYALGLFLSPQSTLNIAYRMFEAASHLPLASAVKDQFRALECLGIERPPLAGLFEHVTGTADSPAGEATRRLANLGHLADPGIAGILRSVPPLMLYKDWEKGLRGLKEDGVASFVVEYRPRGTDNLDVLRTVLPYHHLVSWLDRLATCFREYPGQVDLSALQRWAWILQALGKPDGASAPTDASQPFAMRHSQAFWQPRLEDLAKRCQPATGMIGTADPGMQTVHVVLPTVVLLSKAIGSWCEDSLAVLQIAEETFQMFAPHLGLYRAVLADLQRSAGGFRESAAVQRHLVDSILGHGLLERLDEHACEFWEISHALNPQRGDAQPREQDPAPPSQLDRYSTYVEGRARHLESIPTTLRTLKGLVSTPGQGSPGQGAKLPGGEDSAPAEVEVKVKDLLDGWSVQSGSTAGAEEMRLTHQEARHLALVFGELKRNHEIHGLRERSRVDPAGAAAGAAQQASVACYDDANTISFTFTNLQPEDARRLLEPNIGQRLLDPHTDVRRESHGTGLYLVSLAAAVVGWRLEVSVIEAQPSPSMIVTLARMDRMLAP
ncbi:MAG: hypothetical protein ABIO70_36185 [Pseudomonadota bacterium]